MTINTANVQKSLCTVKNILYAYLNLETTVTVVTHMQHVLLIHTTSPTVSAKKTLEAMVLTSAQQEIGYSFITFPLRYSPIPLYILYKSISGL